MGDIPDGSSGRPEVDLENGVATTSIVGAGRWRPRVAGSGLRGRPTGAGDFETAIILTENLDRPVGGFTWTADGKTMVYTDEIVKKSGDTPARH